MSDGYGDPIPPGHGEPRIHEDGKVYEIATIIPFETPKNAPPWTAAAPADYFGVPHCGDCLYYHRPEEPCRR